MLVLATAIAMSATRRREAAPFHDGGELCASRSAAVLRNSASQRPRQKPVHGRGVMLPRWIGGVVGRMIVEISYGFMLQVCGDELQYIKQLLGQNKMFLLSY